MVRNEICLLALLLNVVLGQKIVEIYDTVKIKVRNDTHLKTFKLQTFPYIADVRLTSTFIFCSTLRTSGSRGPFVMQEMSWSSLCNA